MAEVIDISTRVKRADEGASAAAVRDVLDDYFDREGLEVYLHDRRLSRGDHLLMHLYVHGFRVVPL